MPEVFEFSTVSARYIKIEGTKLRPVVSNEVLPGNSNVGNSLELKSRYNTYVQTPNIGRTLSEMTLSGWIYAKDLRSKSYSTLYADGGASGNGSFKLQVYTTGSGSTEDSRLVFTVGGNAGGNFNGTGVKTTYRRFAEHQYTWMYGTHDPFNHVPDNSWLHVAVVYRPADKTVDFYINGKFDSTQTFTTAQNPVLSGGRLGSSFASNENFFGRIDDFSIYDKVLNEDEIKSLADYERKMWGNKYIDSWSASSNTYYVDASSGNDSNPGTSASPVKTIEKGLSFVQGAGSKLIIRDGTYREGALSLNKSGTPTNPIIIQAEHPGNVNIKGSDIYTGWTLVAGTTNRYEKVWNYDWGLTTDHSTESDIIRRRELVVIDGTVQQPVTALGSMANGTFYVDEINDKIYIQTNSNPNNNNVEVGIRPVLMKFNNAQYVNINGINFSQGSPGISSGSVVFQGCKHFLIEDCQFNQFSGSGFAMVNSGGFPISYVGDYSTGYATSTTYNNEHYFSENYKTLCQDFLVRRTQFNNNGYQGIGSGFCSMDILLEDCEISGNQWRAAWGNYQGADPVATKIMFSKNWTIRRCYFRDNKRATLWFDTSDRNIDVENCYFDSNTYEGIMLENNPEGIVLKNNVLLSSSLALYSVEGFLLKGNVLKNNQVVYGLTSGETRDFSYQGGSGIVNEDYRWINNYFVNEIVKTVPFNSLYSTFISAQNKYYGVHFYNGETYQTYAQWMSNIPQDQLSQNLSTDPFVNDGNFNVQFAQGGTSGVKSNKPAYITVRLSKPVDSTITVNYAVDSTNPGTAVQNTDYVLASGTMTFRPLETEKVIYLKVLNDGTAATGKTVNIKLSSPSAGSLGTNTIHTYVIGGQYNQLATRQIEAEGWDSQAGIRNESCSEGGDGVAYIQNGEYTVYNNVDFGSGVSYFTARVATGGTGGNIEVRLDSPTGTLVGTIPVSSTGGWQTYQTNTCTVSGATGVHNLYLKYTGGAGYLFNVNWFKFNANNISATYQIEAENWNSQSGIQNEACGEGGNSVAYIENGEYTVYNNVDFGSGVSHFLARVATGGTGGNIELRLDSPTGTLVRPIIVEGALANGLTLYDDSGDAWDFPMDYDQSPGEMLLLQNTSSYMDGPRVVRVSTYKTATGKSTLKQKIIMTLGSRRIDFLTNVDWQENGKMLRTSFPVNVFAQEATCEIQFGNIKRPTHRNTSWDMAKYEVCAHKWVDISQGDYGVALLNDCKYGHKLLGNILDMDLLRSSKYPDPVADRGQHQFTYSLYPHSGDYRQGGVVRAAYELNAPLQVIDKVFEKISHSFLRIVNENILLESVKKAEESDKVILRLYEAYGSGTTAKIDLGFEAKDVRLVNMLEHLLPEDEALVWRAASATSIELQFKPFEIHTVELSI